MSAPASSPKTNTVQTVDEDEPSFESAAPAKKIEEAVESTGDAGSRAADIIAMIRKRNQQ